MAAHQRDSIEMKAAALPDMSQSFVSLTETHVQFTSQVLAVISASLVPPHHKFLFMLLRQASFGGPPCQNTPPPPIICVGLLDVVGEGELDLSRHPPPGAHLYFVF